jgi:gluconolactonase
MSTVKIQILDDEMREIVDSDPESIHVGGNFRFTEGPVWMKAEHCLLFSDIPANIIYHWSPAEGVRAWRNPSHNANGNTTDQIGRLLTCEHGSRRATRTEKDGSVTVLAESYQGKKLNSPNDVIVKRDDTIWFTDPPYGIRPDMIEQKANHVFRLDPVTSELVVVADDFSRPNGLCFSPDEQLLYIGNSDTEIHHVRRFKVQANYSLQEEGVFTVIRPGVPDGMRVDQAGRLYCSAGDGIHIFRSDGALLGKILTPQTASNCTFGSVSETTYLFITATNSVWGIALKYAVHEERTI